MQIGGLYLRRILPVVLFFLAAFCMFEQAPQLTPGSPAAISIGIPSQAVNQTFAAHSSVPYALAIKTALVVTGDLTSDINITSDSAVNAVVQCALLNAGQFPAATEYAGASSPSATQASPELSKPLFEQRETRLYAQKKPRVFVVKDRIHLDVPSHPLILAEPTPIEVSKVSPGLLTITGEQEVLHSNSDRRKDKVAGSDATYTLYTSNGKHYITIIPVHLGRTEIDVLTTYADGGISSDRITVDVVPPAKHPLKLIVGDSGRQNVPTIFDEFPLKPGPRTKHRVFVAAAYKDLKQPTDISWDLLSYHVRESVQPPVIRLDSKSGEIIALRQGHSLLEIKYGGLTHLTCITVKAPGPENADRSGCRDLLLNGESLGGDTAESPGPE